VLPALVASRVLWIGVALAAVLVEYANSPLVSGLRATLVSWDAISFLQIAAHGYPPTLDYRDAFLPGFPLLIRGAAFVVRDDVAAAWLIDLVGEAVGLWFVYKLVLAERDRGAAAFSVWLVALLPTAVFFIAPFTEAPFMAAAAASLYYGRQHRFTAAAVAAAAATALRLTGIALLPALLLEELLRHAGSRRRSNAASAAFSLLIIPLPLVLYCLYMRLRTGDALAMFDAQGLPSFGHGVAPPWDALVATWNTMMSAPDAETRSIFAREVAFGLLGLIACVAMWVSTRVPRSLALYCSVAWLMTASLTFWRSEPRYFLALFPAVILVADVTRRSRVWRGALLAASGLLMCAGVWVFATGHWLG
jgi:hypothetical protein